MKSFKEVKYKCRVWFANEFSKIKIKNVVISQQCLVIADFAGFQFMHEIESNSVFSFLDTLVSRTDEGFSTSVYCKNFAVSLLFHAHSCILLIKNWLHFMLLLIAP